MTTQREKIIAAFYASARPVANVWSALHRAQPFRVWAVGRDGQHYVFLVERKTQAIWRYNWLARNSYWLGLSAYGWTSEA